MTSSEPLAHTAPELRPCVRCGVEIHAASGYCTLCGAVQRVPSRGARWLMALGLIAVIAGVAIAGGLLLGSSSGTTDAYTLYRSAELQTLVPRDWTGGPVAAPAPGSARVVFSDPLDSRVRLTVTVVRPAVGTAVRRARRIRAVARSLGDFHQDFFAHVLLPGGRPAWRLTYTGNGYAHVVYVFSACTPAAAMAVDLRAVHVVDLRSLVLHIPDSASANCAVAGVGAGAGAGQATRAGTGGRAGAGAGQATRAGAGGRAGAGAGQATVPSG
jgi:hypothetical protein